VSLSHAAPLPIKPRPYGYPAALDVFPVDPSCFYANTWGAPRSGGRRHEGVDIITARGKPLYAVRDGRVSKKYSGSALAGNGIAIEISDGTYYFYAHLDSFAEGIRKGSRVKAGDVIGYVGSTGNTLVPHLHFEIHPKGGKAVDPTPYIAQVDRCGYKGPKLPKISPPTTTTTEKPTTTAKPTTTEKPTTTARATTTTVKRTTTTVKRTTTTAKPTTTARATTTEKPTTTDQPTSSAPERDGYTPMSAGAPSVELTNSRVKAKATNRIKVSGEQMLPGNLVRADLKITVSGTTKTASVSVSNCDATPEKVVTVRSKRKATKTVVADLNASGEFCLVSSANARVKIEVRRAWTKADRQITITEEVTVLESVEGRKVPSKGNVIRVKFGNFESLPSKPNSVLLSVSATGGKSASTILLGRCGSRRTAFLRVKANEPASKEGWVSVRGGDLCVSATVKTPVVIKVLSVG